MDNVIKVNIIKKEDYVSKFNANILAFLLCPNKAEIHVGPPPHKKDQG